jgi:signal transduction histidine kinase
VKLKLVPDSLFGRLIMALLAAIGITQVVSVALFLQERRDVLVARSDTAAIVNVIAGTVEELTALSVDERAAVVERLLREPLAIDSAAAQARQGPYSLEDPTRAARAVRERLVRALGASYVVTAAPATGGRVTAIRVGRAARMPQFSRPSQVAERAQRSTEPTGDERAERRIARGGGPGFMLPFLDVGVTLPDGELVRFRADVPRAPPPLPMGLLIQLGLLTVVLAGVLYAMARTITRPLADLAAAADAVGRGARTQPLRETGSSELRDATRAFNTMQERLHRYLDSRTRVLSAMSHDLRTPLTRLKLRAESLDDAQLRERFNADLDEMNRMVTGALDLFKGLNYDEPLKDVRIEALLEDLRAEFAEVGGEVTIAGATMAQISVRRDSLKRCLTNLIGNAVKYGARAEVLVEEEGANVVVRIRDDGPGIPPEMLDRVFEPFFRLESSRNVDTGGTGLGLSIARDAAQAHGGSLVLRNLTPRGLEAVLTLPRNATH